MHVVVDVLGEDGEVFEEGFVGVAVDAVAALEEHSGGGGVRGGEGRGGGEAGDELGLVVVELGAVLIVYYP